MRRLAEYEDYALRLLQDAGIAVPRPYGIVEITPEREYLLVTEFFDGAVEIGGADLDDQLIDQGLQLIRALWDAGIAHRDIKPGNLMVRAGQLLLIDVAFAQVRPSPWRQAVDLGNMMLVLAVRTDPARVYRQALNYFTEAELAEAFAATRGVASPTQLRAFMKRDPRDLLAEFRTLAPQRRPIVLQRWSVRRVSLAAAMLAIFAVPTVFGIGLLLPRPATSAAHAPDCGTGHTMILAAQAVPSAAFLPCIAALPSGWTTADAEIASGRASFVLDSGSPAGAGGVRFVLGQPGQLQTVTITLTATCDIAGARQIPSDQPGMRRFERPPSLVPGYSDVRYDVFPGGCVTYRFVLRARRVPGPGHHRRQRGGVHPPVGAGRLRPAHRGPGPVRARCRMPGVTRAATARREEDALLGRPRQAALLTAGVVAVTAVVFALVADHGMLARIQRLDDAWLRLMISGRAPPLTAIAKVFNVLGLVYVTLPVRIALAGFLALRRRWWHLAAFASAIVLSEVLIGSLKGSLRPGQAARVAGRDQRRVVPVRTCDRRVGHRRRGGHRPGARGQAARPVGRGRGGVLDRDGALPRLPGGPLALRRHRRDPARHVLRPGDRPGSRPASATAQQGAATCAAATPGWRSAAPPRREQQVKGMNMDRTQQRPVHPRPPSEPSPGAPEPITKHPGGLCRRLVTVIRAMSSA